MKQMVSLIYIRDKKLLVVQSKKYEPLTLPGGKIEKDSYVDALYREVIEELGSVVVNPRLFGYFDGGSAADPSEIITVAAYFADLQGEPEVQEGESVIAIHWVSPHDTEKVLKLSDVSRRIFDELFKQDYL
ncbi:NUDIX domain-containing protein [Candidatus Parcubacteria bacterium]|nr:NUDIX domain-containing protein [Candidatus Parcubacteria bacterium]